MTVIVSSLLSLTGIANIIYPLLYKEFINGLENKIVNHRIIIQMIFLFSITLVIEFLLTFIYGKVQMKMEARLKYSIFSKALGLPANEIKKRGEGFFIQLVDDAVYHCMLFFSPRVYINVFNFLRSFIIISIMFYFEVISGILGIIVYILYVFIFLINKKYFVPMVEEVLNEYRNVNTLFTERLGLVSLIHAFPFFKQSVKKEVTHSLTVLAKKRFRTVIMLITYFGSMEHGFSGIAGLTDIYFKVTTAVKAVDQFLKEKMKQQPIINDNKEYFFRVESLTLYQQEKPILKNINFTLDIGNQYALVGMTGKGKTTLLSFLTGEIMPENGKVTFMNPFNSCFHVKLNEKISFLSQSTPLINLNMEENILLGSSKNVEKLNQIIEELEIDYLNGRKLGILGGQVSGGERQKINLARFLYHLEEKDFYIIDESFIFLDIISQNKLLAIVKKYIADKTGIIISHNPEIIHQLSDKIIFLENPDSIIITDHNHLLKQSSFYRGLMNE